MSVDNEILKQLKTKKIRIEANKEIIRNIVKEKFGVELPFPEDGNIYDKNKTKLIQMINVLFEALAESAEKTSI